jgi:Protein of unknown function (DUF4232)
VNLRDNPAGRRHISGIASTLTAMALLLLTATGVDVATTATVRSSTRFSQQGMSSAAGTSAPISECTSAQLSISYFASSAAAGTGLAGIGVANSALTPCWLSGVPSVEFFVTSSSGKTQSLSVHLESAPTNISPAHPRRVTLDHAKSVTSALGQRYRAVSTGFVILGRDFPNGSASCVNVTSLLVRLPGVSRTYEASTRTFADGRRAVFNLCDRPPPVEVTQIFARSRFLSFVIVGS